MKIILSLILFISYTNLGIAQRDQNHRKTDIPTKNSISSITAPEDSLWDDRFGGMINNNVYTIAINNTDIYVGGEFTSIDTLNANRIAKWNGSSWSSLGGGLNGTVTSIVANGNDIYVGGVFTTAGGISANNIAKWNGSSWSALGSGTNLPINSLAFSNGILYAGGAFTTAGGVSANYIAKWDGSNWAPLGSGVNNVVEVIHLSGNIVYVGGHFTFAGSQTANMIAKWDGYNWSPLGTGMNDIVYAIMTTEVGDVVAGGIFTSAGGQSVNYIALWNGSNWLPMGSGMQWYVYALAVKVNAVYAGGAFTTSGGITTNYIAKWNGKEWFSLGSGMNDVVWTVALTGNRVYAGGAFMTAGGKSSSHFGQWTNPPGSISGIKFNDLNGNGNRDGIEPGYDGWTIYLQNLQKVNIDSIATDLTGKYKFDNLPDGKYFVTEIQDSEWIQTYPPAPGNYLLTIQAGIDETGIDFGNTQGYRYIGPDGGYWSDSTAWTGSHPPTDTDAVMIPSSITVNVDSLPNDSIPALRVRSWGNLTFSPKVSKLKTAGIMQLDKNATIQLPDNSDSTGLICYRDFVNKGNLIPGQSTISFQGDAYKTILSEASNTVFNNLIISGDSTHSSGTIVTKGHLVLQRSLTPGVMDTVYIDTTSTEAIENTGKIVQGTVKRKILQGETDAYRFESQDTYLKFDGSGVYPTSMAVTTLPDTMTPCTRFRWEVVESTVDTVNNTISADSITNFSKWRVGIPRPQTSGPEIGIKREYIIRPKDGNDYRVQMQLSYKQSEILPGINEGQLKLLRGPWYVDSVVPDWNMLTPPLVPENDLGSVMFPGASSPFYGYNGSEYYESTNLNFGVGYWAKFPSIQHISILGDDKSEDTIMVVRGWNLIGVLSYKLLDVQTITSLPLGIISSHFYGYNKGYYQADSLIPMHAYWLKVEEPGAIILKSDEIEENILRKVTIPTKASGINKLTILDDVGNKQELFYCTSTVNSIDIKKYDLPPLPPAGAFDVRYSTGKMLEVVQGDECKEIPILISSATYPLKICWELDQDEKLGNAYIKVNDKLSLLTPEGTLVIQDASELVSLLITAEKNAEIPKEYTLYQNYPNPFNPITKIEYQLPFDSKVKIAVCNVLGQVVTVLADAIETAGTKSIEWNSNNVASGVYFYRLEATSIGNPSKVFTQVKKMVVVK